MHQLNSDNYAALPSNLKINIIIAESAVSGIMKDIIVTFVYLK